MEGGGAVQEDDPLVAGVVRGIRKWEVGQDQRGNPRLLGYANWAWQPWGRPTIAACLAHQGAGHAGWGDGDEVAPGTNCTCGLYAHHPWARKSVEDFDLLSGVSPEDDWLIGVVEAWGRLEVHKNGFRAQYARPVLLVAATPEVGWKTETLEEVASEYRCSAVRVESAGDLGDLFGEVSGALDPSFVNDLVASIPEPPPWTPPPPPRVRTWSEPRDWMHLTNRSVETTLGIMLDGLEFLVRAIGALIMGSFAVLMWITWAMMVAIVIGGCGAAVVQNL